MYELKNEELTVQILDPRRDHLHLGARYCTGGYIWQVADKKHGDLLSGPQYPAKEPDTYHGQGAPDMFLETLNGKTAAVGERVGVVGVGNVRRTTQEPFHVSTNREVTEPIDWRVDMTPDQIGMTGEHTLGDWSYSLSRMITLSRRTVSLRTTLHNRGTATVPLCAFAHPFFPPNAGLALCRFTVPVKAFESPGFYLDAEGWICRHPGHDWVQGAYQRLEYERRGESLQIIQRHDRLGQVVTVLDFMPAHIAIWGNDRTFSFEPFIEQDVVPGASVGWTVEYRF